MEHLRRLAQGLIDDGCSRIFGIPGSGPSLSMLDTYESLGGEFVLTHFEGAAAIMAGTMGRLSGRAGACVSIKGPGLANMSAGLSACMLDAFPVVSVSEGVVPGAPVHAAHKRMDHHRLLSASVKEARYLSEDTSFANQARAAEAECPGPVHLDICAKPVSASPAVFTESSALAGDMEQCLRLLESSSRPVVIAGTWAMRRGLSEALNALRVPVLSTAAAKGVIDEFLPHACGVYTGAGRELAPEVPLLQEADLVVGLGLRHNEVLGGFPLPVPTVLFDCLGSFVNSGFGAAAAADPGESGLDAVFAALRDKAWGADLAQELVVHMREALLQEPDLPARVFAGLQPLWNGQARLVVDTGIYCTVAEHIWQARSESSFLGSGQGRYMGVGLPQAIAAAMYDGRPEAPTVLVTGDGGIGMYVAELKTAVARRLPLVVVLLTDGGFGTLRGRCLREGIGQGPLTFSTPSWAAVMEGLGLQAARAACVEDIAGLLPDRVESPCYVEVAFEPERYARMTDALR